MPKGQSKLDPNNYKGYNIGWLRGLGSEHPDFDLVAEYDNKVSKIKVNEVDEEAEEVEAEAETTEDDSGL
ncbi:MAG: hypothetical protein A2Z42_04265 [Candidatus Woykebacteria bacterium RBG_19FT_COMBO_43_10]|uniref:Uncharacterized protein n=1 Tax=Candidatus Woykebacteria bacterium RBG_19FT_COMBO_43_10 TaxID=1802598 RepID=A0A1G1WJQ4_9BACT|nr:MAG: hypothetical protein A2Z42_04265 [Candidatus Woykebacteria bacterium RBG_19FT_COMBO_43_10]